MYQHRTNVPFETAKIKLATKDEVHKFLGSRNSEFLDQKMKLLNNFEKKQFQLGLEYTEHGF